MGLLDSFAAGYKRGEGRRYLGEKNYEKALERYQSSLKIDPNNRQAFRGMGLAFNGKESIVLHWIISQKLCILNQLIINHLEVKA